MIRKSFVVFLKRLRQVGVFCSKGTQQTWQLINQDNKFDMKKIVLRINGTINLHYDFSVLKQTFEETKQQQHSPIHQSNISNLQQKHDQTPYKAQSQQPSPTTQQINNKYIHLINMYKQNKRRLHLQTDKLQQTILYSQISNQNQSILFDQQYLKKMLQIKYYYADVVNVASWLTQKLISGVQVKNNDMQEGQKLQQNDLQMLTQQNIFMQSSSISNISPITVTHIHFLLYVYHLYPKQSKNLKDRMIILIDNFIDSGKLLQIKINQNMEFFFYLRKFIQNEDYHKINKKINNLNVKYTQMLKKSYMKEKQQLNESFMSKQNSSEVKDKNIKKFGKQMKKKIQLLNNYLLIFPNLWNMSTKQTTNNNNTPSSQQDKRYNKKHNKSNIPIPSQQLLQIFDYFVQQFSSFLLKSIQHWLRHNISDINLRKLQHNTTYKRLLEEQFKQMQLKLCFNMLKLLTHRLFVIFDPPKMFYQKGSSSQSQTKSNKEQTQFDSSIQEHFDVLIKKYSLEKLNFLTYLSTQKLQSQAEFLTLLVLIKHLASYHTIRDIDNQFITNFLVTLFENNSHLIYTKKPQFRREIKYTIGELVSKLASCSWVDKNDELSRFFVAQVIEVEKPNNKGKRNNKGQWYEVKEQ